MITPIDLENFSKIASEAYLKNKTPLNETITKLASDNGLTKEQVNRVVEGANTDVYLKLFNNSDDKYVTFDTADRSSIYESLAPVEKTADVIDLDYTEAPEEVHALIKEAEIFPAAQEAEHEYPDELLRAYYKLAAVNTRIEETMAEVDISFRDAATTLQGMIKQAVLGGASYGDIHKALTLAHENDPIINAVLTETEQYLTENAPRVNLEKTSSITGRVNTGHPLLIQTGKLLKIAEEYKLLKTKLSEVNDEWQNIKTAESKSKILKGLAATAKHPGVFLAGAAAAVPATLVGMKNHQEQMMSPLRQIPKGYGI